MGKCGRQACIVWLRRQCSAHPLAPVPRPPPSAGKSGAALAAGEAVSESVLLELSEARTALGMGEKKEEGREREPITRVGTT